MKSVRLHIFLILVACLGSVAWQSPTGDTAASSGPEVRDTLATRLGQELLDQVKNAYSRIEDYTVRIFAGIQMPGLRVPPMNIKMYYKRPDKLHFESRGFAILPKGGVAPNPDRMLPQFFQIQAVYSDTIQARPCAVVVINSANSRGGEMEMKLWIDRERNTVHRMESQTEGGSKLSAVFERELMADRYWLPLKTEVMIDISDKETELPKHSIPLFQGLIDLPFGEGRTGRIVMNFRDYRINRGIPDEVFEEEE